MSLPYERPVKYNRRGSYQEIIAKNIFLTYIGFCHQATSYILLLLFGELTY